MEEKVRQKVQTFHVQGSAVLCHTALRNTYRLVYVKIVFTSLKRVNKITISHQMP